MITTRSELGRIVSTLSPEQRFDLYYEPEPNSGCWIWIGPRTSPGYGELWMGTYKRLAHRYSYEAAHGPIPQGKQLDHLCRMRCCVNPAHLEPVTCRENLLRGETRAAANAGRVLCRLGHTYDTVNVRGERVCRQCAAATTRRYFERQRARQAIQAV